MPTSGVIVASPPATNSESSVERALDARSDSDTTTPSTAAGWRARPPRRITMNAQADHPLKATLVSRHDVRRHLLVHVDPDHAYIRVELAAPDASDGASGRGACTVSRPSRTSITAVGHVDLAHGQADEYPELDVTLAVTWSRRFAEGRPTTDVSGTALLFSGDGQPPEEFRALNADPHSVRDPDPVGTSPDAAAIDPAARPRVHGRIRLPRPRGQRRRAPRPELGGRWIGYAIAIAIRRRGVSRATAT